MDILCKKNLQLKELKLYIRNIIRCQGTVALLYTRKQDNQFNTIIKCCIFLQVNYLQIIQRTSVIQSNLQDKPNIYSSSCISPQKHNQYLQRPLKPQNVSLLLIFHLMRQKLTLSLQSNN